MKYRLLVGLLNNGQQRVWEVRAASQRLPTRLGAQDFPPRPCIASELPAIHDRRFRPIEGTPLYARLPIVPCILNDAIRSRFIRWFRLSLFLLLWWFLS